MPRVSVSEVIEYLLKQNPADEVVLHQEDVADPDATVVLDFIWSDL